ncbi:translation initiation factor IF-2 N-terminal domain-containing protein, partial [Anaerotignum sp.]
MSKMRIYELAKQLGVANKELMEKMKSVGMEANSHMSMIEESDADKIRKLYQPAQKAEEPKKEAPKQEVKEQHKGNQQKEAPKQDNRNKGENKKAQDGKNQQNNNNQNKNNQNKNRNNNAQNNQNQGKKDKKGKGKKDQKPRENPLERRRREMEEEAALLAELEALEAAEKAAEPVIKSIPASISVKELAEVLGKKGSDLVMALMKKGQMLNINATLDFDTAAAIAEDYNVILEQEEEKDILETVFAEEEDDEKDLKERPPVVVVMGHVDHGKTSLL